MRILIIDDSQEQLEALKDIFESEDYRAVTCQDPLQSLQLMANNLFDCVILDLRMPVLEGNHLLTIIKEKYPHLPVVVLSAHIDNEGELLEKGAYAVLRKPPEITSLLATVENAINESGNSIKFIFTHLNLRKIKDNVISRMIALALKKTNGNQQRASDLLGISRQCLIRYMKKYKIFAH